MKSYKEIPQLTKRGSYEVHQPLESIAATINDWQQGKNDPLQLCPDFQRGHVWTGQQQIKFVEFLLRGGDTNNIIYFNHPNWLGNFRGDFVLVDGLQRLTAVLKFLRNELTVFGGHYKDDFEERIPFNVHLRFNVNNLKTREEVLQWYLEMNAGSTPHTEAELSKVRGLLLLEKKV